LSGDKTLMVIYGNNISGIFYIQIYIYFALNENVMNKVIVLIYSRYFCLHVCTSIYNKDLIFLLALLVSIPLFSKEKLYSIVYLPAPFL